MKEFFKKAFDIVEKHRREYHGVYYMKGSLWDTVRDTGESAASLAGNYFLPGSSILSDQLVSKGSQSQLGSTLGQIAQIGSGLAGAGIGSSYTGIPGAASIGGGYTNVANDLGGVVGDPTLGSDIGSSLSNFTNSTGLSSLFGGTPQSASNLSSVDNGLNSSVGSLDTATSAATPGSAVAAPGASSFNPTGGGSSGGGFDLSMGSDSLPSSTGIGGGFAAPDLNGNIATPTASSAFSGVGASQGNGSLLSNLGQATGLSSQTPIGSANFDLSGNPVGASAAPASDAVGNSINSAVTGGNVGNTSSILGSLFGQGSGTNALNGILRSGLSYLGNNSNQAGYNGISNAAQQAQAQYQPYLASGTAANGMLGNLYGQNGQAAETAAQQNFENTPGYQFQLQQGENAVNANAAKMGQVLSGNNQQAINNYAQGTAQGSYNNYVQNLQQQAAQGLSAAGGYGTVGLTGANAQAQAGQNKANASNQLVGGIGQALFPSAVSAGSSGIQQLLSSLFS